MAGRVAVQGISGFDFQAYADKVAAFIRDGLEIDRSRAGIAGRMHLLTTALERDLRRFGDGNELSLVACAPGCSSCCIVNVALLVPEALTITHFLLHHYPADQCNMIGVRLEELHCKTRWLDDEDRIFLREPCAFLDRDGSCLIHKVRPLLCRSITSLDGEACRSALANVTMGEMPSVAMNLFQKNLFEAAYQGLSEGLVQLGLDDRPWRLTPAIYFLLKDTALVSQFFAGERIVRH